MMVAFSGKVSPRSTCCNSTLPSLHRFPHEQLLRFVVVDDKFPFDEEPFVDEPFAEEPFVEEVPFPESIVLLIMCKVDNNESVDPDFLCRHSSQSTQVN